MEDIAESRNPQLFPRQLVRLARTGAADVIECLGEENRILKAHPRGGRRSLSYDDVAVSPSSSVGPLPVGFRRKSRRPSTRLRTATLSRSCSGGDSAGMFTAGRGNKSWRETQHSGL